MLASVLASQAVHGHPRRLQHLTVCTLLSTCHTVVKWSSWMYREHSSSQTCLTAMGSLTVTCHLAEVTFPPLPQPIKAGTRFSDPAGCKAELTWFGYIRGGILAKRWSPIPVLTGLSVVQWLQSYDERHYCYGQSTQQSCYMHTFTVWLIDWIISVAGLITS